MHGQGWLGRGSLGVASCSPRSSKNLTMALSHGGATIALRTARACRRVQRQELKRDTRVCGVLKLRPQEFLKAFACPNVAQQVGYKGLWSRVQKWPWKQHVLKEIWNYSTYHNGLSGLLPHHPITGPSPKRPAMPHRSEMHCLGPTGRPSIGQGHAAP